MFRSARVYVALLVDRKHRLCCIRMSRARKVAAGHDITARKKIGFYRHRPPYTSRKSMAGPIALTFSR